LISTDRGGDQNELSYQIYNKKNEAAFTGLEAAIILIAFIVVAATFTYVVLEPDSSPHRRVTRQYTPQLDRYHRLLRL
jgi:hypothetical protein